MDLAFWVATTDAVHVTQVPCVHTYQQVEALIVVTRHLARRLALARDTVFGEFPLGWRIDLVADLLRRGGCRFDEVAADSI